jgi:predicted secreted hydrolase
MRYFSVISVVLAVILTGIFLQGCAPQEEDRIDIAQALSDVRGIDCFDSVTAPRPLIFPEDAGPHETFRTEWWYYTGNLTTGQGRHFGYQLTFFRQALSCEPVTGDSRWRTRQLYFAHFAVTDTQNKAFYAASRMNRESLGIAGSRAQPFHVWIDDWQVQQSNEHLVLTAQDGDISLSLELTRTKPAIFQGERGYSQKGPGTGNASYYYSFPRLSTRGTIAIDDNRFQVSGTTWFDHEWSTTVLGDEVKGWDWFSAHLADGRDLVVCRIRNADGTSNGYGFGSISFADGTYEILSESDFTLVPKTYWKSPDTGTRYPVVWHLTIAAHNLDLMVEPVINNQEHTHAFAYWEGAMRFFSPNVQGMGYLEMTGY